MAGMLSSPGDLLFFIGLIAAWSSSREKSPVEMSSGSDIVVREIVWLSGFNGGGWPRSFWKCSFQLLSRLAEEPPLVVMDGLLFLPDKWLMVFHAAVCSFSLCSLPIAFICPWINSASAVAYARSRNCLAFRSLLLTGIVWLMVYSCWTLRSSCFFHKMVRADGGLFLLSLLWEGV